MKQECPRCHPELKRIIKLFKPAQRLKWRCIDVTQELIKTRLVLAYFTEDSSLSRVDFFTERIASHEILMTPTVVKANQHRAISTSREKYDIFHGKNLFLKTNLLAWLKELVEIQAPLDDLLRHVAHAWQNIEQTTPAGVSFSFSLDREIKETCAKQGILKLQRIH